MSNPLQSLLKPTGQNLALWGVGALVALYVVPKLVPALFKAIGNAAGELAGGTIRAGAELAGQAVNAVSPFNQENIIYDGIVGGVGRQVTEDGESFTLGGWFYDLIHVDYDPNKLPEGKQLVDLQKTLPGDPSKRPQFLK